MFVIWAHLGKQFYGQACLTGTKKKENCRNLDTSIVFFHWSFKMLIISCHMLLIWLIHHSRNIYSYFINLKEFNFPEHDNDNDTPLISSKYVEMSSPTIEAKFPRSDVGLKCNMIQKRQINWQSSIRCCVFGGKVGQERNFIWVDRIWHYPNNVRELEANNLGLLWNWLVFSSKSYFNIRQKVK